MAGATTVGIVALLRRELWFISHFCVVRYVFRAWLIQMNRCCTWHCLCRSCESVGSSDSLDSLLDESARFNFDTELSRDCLQFAAKMFRYEFSGFFRLQLVGVRVFIHLRMLGLALLKTMLALEEIVFKNWKWQDILQYLFCRRFVSWVSGECPESFKQMVLYF